MDAAELESTIAQVLAEEAELRFPSFSNDQAISLGAAIAERARSRGLSVTVDVRRGSQQIFHLALAGTSADNDHWIERKARVVERFGHSSYLIGLKLAHAGLSIEDKYAVSSMDYSAHGGSFPIHVVGTGIVGSVTVSGLAQEADHGLVVEAIRDFLQGA
jgi:Uncharacterized conserved protein